MTLEDKFKAQWSARPYTDASDKNRAWYWFAKGAESAPEPARAEPKEDEKIRRVPFDTATDCINSDGTKGE